MADINYLFSGVQAIHMTNHTHTTREGYMSNDDLKNLPELQYYGLESSYYNLSQGMYKISIDGTMYVFLLHDTLFGSDRLIINSYNDAYCILSLQYMRINLYKVHPNRIISNLGYQLSDAVNDDLDIIVMDGYTYYEKPVVPLELDYPRSIEHTSVYNIRVTNGITMENNDFLFNTKTHIKSIDKSLFDRIYIDRPMKRALCEFKVGSTVLSGQEIITKLNQFEQPKNTVYFIQNTLIKPGGRIKCTHLNEITWEQLLDPEYTDNGICSGSPEYELKGIYLKIDNLKYPNENIVKSIIQDYYQGKYESRVKTPMTIVFELKNSYYGELILDSYSIPVDYNISHLIITPYRFYINDIERSNSNIAGIVPKDDIIKSMIDQEIESEDAAYYSKILQENYILRDIILTGEFDITNAWYFYKHFKP